MATNVRAVTGIAHRAKVKAPQRPASRGKAVVKAPQEKRGVGLLAYRSGTGVDAYVRLVRGASPMDIMEIERTGVAGSFLKDLSKKMDLPAAQVFRILGVPRTSGESKAAKGQLLTGKSGLAAVGLIKLVGIAQEIVNNSTAAGAKNFDSVKWLGQWVERPQPSLGGRKPSDMLDTPTGVDVVARLLGSMQSGAYQ